MEKSQEHLLAVDVGLHTGLALFANDGTLLWYRSHHLPSQGKLKKILFSLLETEPRPTQLILEGSGPLADIWVREAERRKLPLMQIHAESWRVKLLFPRQQRNAQQAKQFAIKSARKIIVQLGGKRPTALRHDTAEAILIGFYGLLELGWLSARATAIPSLLSVQKS